MPATFGLSHIAMEVGDLDRAVAFYEVAFGARCYQRDSTSAQVLGPGPTDVIAFELGESPWQQHGLLHFGFRLTGPREIDTVVERALGAGGRLKARGDFGDDQPYAFILDPDGYEIEIWHENTPHHAQD